MFFFFLFFFFFFFFFLVFYVDFGVFDRVILVPGPLDEVAIVRSIYRMFVEENRAKAEIARRLQIGRTSVRRILR